MPSQIAPQSELQAFVCRPVIPACPFLLSREGSRMMDIVVPSLADSNLRTSPQVVAPLELDLGRFAEFDGQL
eukprot:COSAG02_NODE_39612_length_415_cov_0.655063_1_plen_71_part_10